MHSPVFEMEIGRSFTKHHKGPAVIFLFCHRHSLDNKWLTIVPVYYLKTTTLFSYSVPSLPWINPSHINDIATNNQYNPNIVLGLFAFTSLFSIQSI